MEGNEMASLFLVIGIILSVTSKWLQLRGQSDVGDLLVFPAAFFLGLALLFSLPFFKEWWEDPASRPKAYRFATFATVGVLSFQLFAWLLFGQGEWLGFLFLIPFLTCLYFVIRTVI